MLSRKNVEIIARRIYEINWKSSLTRVVNVSPVDNDLSGYSSWTFSVNGTPTRAIGFINPQDNNRLHHIMCWSNGAYRKYTIFNNKVFLRHLSLDEACRRKTWIFEF